VCVFVRVCLFAIACVHRCRRRRLYAISFSGCSVEGTNERRRAS